MKRQKVCIIGGGLTGLITAIALSKLNLKVDLITDNINKHIKTNRTMAISQNNYDFLEKLKIFKFSKKEFWPCTKMKLYTRAPTKEFTEIFEFSRDNNQKKQILYMIKNSMIARHMVKNIKKKKIISLKNQKKIYSVVSSGILKSIKLKSKDNFKYNLIIICTGSDSHLVKTLFNDQPFKHSYDEISITITLKHSFIKNNIARQIFLDNEILALLPISNTKTSIVWSVKKNIMSKYKNKNDLLLKRRIKLYTKYFLKNIKFVSGIEYKDLNLLIRKKYYHDRVLLFGDALHVVHPLAGQGFNMILRDLSSLEKILKDKISLGLDIGSSEILSEVANETQPRNFIYSLGIDFFKKSFSFQKKPIKNFRNNIITGLNKNNFVKDIFFNLADRGLKF